MEKILQEGRNCWRMASAKRLAFLIDAADYFAAFYAAVAQAEESVLIVGWDINSQLRLLRDDESHELPVCLGDFLNELVSRRPDLEVHVLAWDFAMIFALERQLLPLYWLEWRTHKRLHFYMDDQHPVGASHHQKIVVVDDALAFVGGIDLTKCRWDTSEHRASDPRRIDPGEEPYGPFHDVQMMVEGEPAAALGDLARARWRRATGKEIPAPKLAHEARWPEGFLPDMEKVQVAIARTEPAYDGRAEVREVERLYLDAIAAARRSIYIENQYLCAQSITKALAASLEQTDGPDIVLVLPCQTRGWLEQATMDVLRARCLRSLRDADRHGRLRVYCPRGPGLGEEGVNVHAKVLVVDDFLLRIGSSNLSNRSMGFDTECDLAVEADNGSESKQAIEKFRNRLLAEHLGVDAETVARTLAANPSLIVAIESLRGGERTLEELHADVPQVLEQNLPEAMLIDPERPMNAEDLCKRFLPGEADMQQAGSGKDRPWLKGALLLGGLLALAAVWRWTPLGQALDAETLAAWAGTLRNSVLGPVAALGAFLLGSLVVFPVTVLIVVCALVFGPFAGFCYALLGAVLSAAANYGIGHVLGRNAVRRLAGSRINHLSRRLARRGVLTIAVVRMLPVAPFTVVNMVAGASHVRFRDFMLGTLLGMGPGTLALTVFADSLYGVVRDPQPASFAWLGVVAVVVIAGAYGIRRWLWRRGDARALPAESKA